MYQQIKIQDINTAAFLIVRGHRVETISRDGPIISWHFLEGETLQSDIKDFISGDAFGDCKRFADGLKTLKQTIRTH